MLKGMFLLLLGVLYDSHTGKMCVTQNCGGQMRKDDKGGWPRLYPSLGPNNSRNAKGGGIRSPMKQARASGEKEEEEIDMWEKEEVKGGGESIISHSF